MPENPCPTARRSFSRVPSNLLLEIVKTVPFASVLFLASAITGHSASFTISAPVNPMTGANNLLLGLDDSLYISFDSEPSVPTTIQWKLNGTPIPGATNRVLRFFPVQAENAGTYSVVASNALDLVTSKASFVTVKSARPGATLDGDSPLGILLGNSLSLHPSVSGAPFPQIQWRKNGLVLPGQTNYALFIPVVSEEDAGAYDLVLSNIAGTAKSNPFQIAIGKLAPQFIRGPSDIIEVAGNRIELEAEAIGGPPPRYEWKHNGALLQNQTNSRLVLPQLSLESAGVYEVVALNELGENRLTSRVTVQRNTGLDQWTWRLPRPQGAGLADIAWGNGRFVAVGNGGNVIVSTKGIDWMAAAVPANCQLRSISFGNGIFVAAGSFTNDRNVTGSGLVCVSSDGIHWEFGKNPEHESLFDIACGNGVFIATGNAGRAFAYRSTNGLDWSPQPPNPFPGASVVWGDGFFLLGDAGGAVHASSDGTAWRTIFSKPRPVQRLSYVGGSLLAWFGEVLAMSSDYTNWAQNLSPLLAPASQHSIAAGKGIFGCSGD